jgi:uncharacterized membrane protein
MDFYLFAQKYFISPIWERSGYNMVNTLAYAFIALVALYFIWKYFEKKGVQVDSKFWAGALAFVLWGSSLRVLTDSIDLGTMAKTLEAGGGIFYPIASLFYPFILSSHILDYGYFTVTPGIYILTATIFLTTLFVQIRLKKKYLTAAVGLFGAAINFVLILPMAKHWEYAIVPAFISAVIGIGLWHALGWRKRSEILPVMGQALDGAATWVAIDWFGPASGKAYFEQHVISAAIGSATPIGFGLFFLLKIFFSLAAVWIIRKEEMDENAKSLVLLVIAIIGFAPGIRDMLRILAGT